MRVVKAGARNGCRAALRIAQKHAVVLELKLFIKLDFINIQYIYSAVYFIFILFIFFVVIHVAVSNPDFMVTVFLT